MHIHLVLISSLIFIIIYMCIFWWNFNILLKFDEIFFSLYFFLEICYSVLSCYFYRALDRVISSQVKTRLNSENKTEWNECPLKLWFVFYDISKRITTLPIYNSIVSPICMIALQIFFLCYSERNFSMRTIS